MSVVPINFQTMGIFNFKQFSIDDSHSAMKVGTDAVLLGAWVDLSGVNTIVDAGCGSGVIALMAAQRTDGTDARIIGVDISPDACLDAARNIKASQWEDRVEVMEADITRVFPAVSHPLLIVSNPPFFNERLRSPDSMRALARHGEEFGIESLIAIASARLISQGDTLAFIAPTSRTDEIEFMLSLQRLSARRICKVFSKVGKASIRTLWQVGHDNYAGCALCREELYIRSADNRFTPDYQILTSPFYLDR